MNIFETLKGNRTYLTVGIIVLCLLGARLHWWVCPPELYLAMFGAAIGFLRAGVKNDQDKSTVDLISTLADQFKTPPGAAATGTPRPQADVSAIAPAAPVSQPATPALNSQPIC